MFKYSDRMYAFIVSVQKKDAPLFTCQEEASGDASFGLVSRVSIFWFFFLHFMSTVACDLWKSVVLIVSELYVIP